MKFTFLSVPTFEAWDYLNPDEVGIGGSETSHIEMAQRLARRGCDVRSYGAPPYLGPVIDPAGVPWRWWDKAFDKTDEGFAGDRGGVWVLYREPKAIDLIPPGVPLWHVCQDVDYNDWTPERIERCTRVIALCEEQKRFLEFRHPEMAGRVFVSSNGVRPEIIKAALAKKLPRNPKRLIYPSSPDRGLMNLIPIFERARELDPALELHVYYGFDNIDKVIAREQHVLGESGGPVEAGTRVIREALDKPGIFVHGRTPQAKLAEEWVQAGIWCHPSNFQETSCITCMDAQAMGAIPISNPIWAVGENVDYGLLIDGNAANYVVRSLYALELWRLANNPQLQAKIRAEMMPAALRRFNWENFVDQWLGWAREDLSRPAPSEAARREEAVTA